MDILKNYTNKVATIIFANKISKETFENGNSGFATYAFLVPKKMELYPGDYVIVECSTGLQVGVFYCYSNKLEDIEMAYRYIVSKLSDYSVYNYK